MICFDVCYQSQQSGANNNAVVCVSVAMPFIIMTIMFRRTSVAFTAMTRPSVYPYRPRTPSLTKWGRPLPFPAPSLSWVYISLSAEWTLKGIVHPKMKICWKCTCRQAIQDVDEFGSSSDLAKFTITSLAHHGFSAVNGCRQNESPNSW